MTPIFRYNAHRQVLVEQARMQKPDPRGYKERHMASDIGTSVHLKKWAEYDNHIASLREYPVAPGDWNEYEEYREGINFLIITDDHPDFPPRTLALLHPDAEPKEVSKPVEGDPSVKAKVDLIWEMIMDWQDAKNYEPDDRTFSFNEIEADLYDWLEKVDPKNEAINRHTYTRADLIAAAEKAWEAAISSVQRVGARLLIKGEIAVQEDKKQYFSQTFNHKI